MINEQEKLGKGPAMDDQQPESLHPKRIINFITSEPAEKHEKYQVGEIQGKNDSRGVSYHPPTSNESPIILFETPPRRNADPLGDDALMVIVHLSDYLVKIILVDNGGSNNLLVLPAFKEMDLLKDQLTLNITTIFGFNREATRSIGEITILVYADGVVK